MADKNYELLDKHIEKLRQYLKNETRDQECVPCELDCFSSTCKPILSQRFVIPETR